MNFEHDALVVYLKGVSPKLPKAGENEHLSPMVDLTLQIDHGHSEGIWAELLETFMGGSDTEGVDYMAIVEGLGAWFDSPLKFHRTYENHRVNFWLSTEKLASICPAKIHKAKIEWANDHHDTRILLAVTGEISGEVIGVLSEYLGHKLRLEALCPQGDMFDEQEDETGG